MNRSIFFIASFMVICSQIANKVHAQSSVSSAIMVFWFNCDWTPSSASEGDYDYDDEGAIQFRVYNKSNTDVSVAIVATPDGGSSVILNSGVVLALDSGDIGASSIPPGPGKISLVDVTNQKIIQTQSYGNPQFPIAETDVFCSTITTNADRALVEVREATLSVSFESYSFIPETPTKLRIYLNGEEDDDVLLAYDIVVGSQLYLMLPLFNIPPVLDIDDRYHWLSILEIEVAGEKTVIDEGAGYPDELTAL